jgi:hypothetical protein
MPDTLQTFTQAMALLPDNNTRLIDPGDVRSANISLMQDRGAAFGDPAAAPWVVPMPVVNSWVDLPQAIGGSSPGGMVSGDALFWRMDSNGQLRYDYAADWPPIVVPPGYTRQVLLLGVVELDPNGNIYEFAFSIGGVVELPTYRVDTSTATNAISLTFVSGDPIDVSAAPPVSIKARNLSNTQPLNLRLISMRASGGVLA